MARSSPRGPTAAISFILPSSDLSFSALIYRGSAVWVLLCTSHERRRRSENPGLVKRLYRFARHFLKHLTCLRVINAAGFWLESLSCLLIIAWPIGTIRWTIPGRLHSRQVEHDTDTRRTAYVNSRGNSMQSDRGRTYALTAKTYTFLAAKYGVISYSEEVARYSCNTCR